jgi:hypothetical protein
MEYKYIVLTNTTIGAFMSQLDGNIVLIALPTITRKLSASAFEALWVLMGYILMTAVLLLLFGRLADMYGKVRLYNLGFLIFTIGSGLCSLAISGTMLVFFRLVQGVGAALIWANNAAILTDAFPPNERGRAIGVNLVAGISGSVIGLILGGVLTVALGWQSIFWINLPIGAFATFWAYKKLKELGTVKHERIDLPGNLLFAGGLSAFLIGLTLGALSGYTVLDFVMSRVWLRGVENADSFDGFEAVQDQTIYCGNIEQFPRFHITKWDFSRTDDILPGGATLRRAYRWHTSDTVRSGLRYYRPAERLSLRQIWRERVYHRRSLDIGRGPVWVRRRPGQCVLHYACIAHGC